MAAACTAADLTVQRLATCRSSASQSGLAQRVGVFSLRLSLLTRPGSALPPRAAHGSSTAPSQHHQHHACALVWGKQALPLAGIVRLEGDPSHNLRRRRRAHLDARRHRRRSARNPHRHPAEQRSPSSWPAPVTRPPSFAAACSLATPTALHPIAQSACWATLCCSEPPAWVLRPNPAFPLWQSLHPFLFTTHSLRLPLLRDRRPAVARFVACSPLGIVRWPAITFS